MTEDSQPRRSLAASAALLTVAGAVGTALSFVLGVILARVLSKDELGTYKQVYLLYTIISPFFTAAIPASLLYMIPRLDKEKKAQFTGQTILVLGIAGAALGAFLFATAGLWAELFKNPDLTVQLRVFSVLPLFAMPAAVLLDVAIAYGRSRIAAFTAVGFAILSFVLTASAAFLTRAVEPIIAVSVIVAIITFVVSMYYVRTIVGPFPLKIDRAMLREQLAYTIPLALSSLAGLLAYQTDRMLVSSFFTPAVFAVYAVGAVEVPFVSMVSQNVNAVLTPRISGLYSAQRYGEIVDLYREAVRKTALVILPFFGYLLWMTASFYAFLYPGYEGSVPIFRIYLILLPLRVATYGLILQATGKTRMILIGSVIYLAGNAALGAVLIPFLGVAGPAWATVITTFAIAWFYLSGSGKRIGVAPWRLLPWASVLTLIAVSLISGAFAFAAGWFVRDTPLVALIVGAVAFAPFYVGLALLTRAMRRDDVLRVWSWLRRAAPSTRRGAPSETPEEAKWPSGEETVPPSMNEPTGTDLPNSPTLL